MSRHFSLRATVYRGHFTSLARSTCVLMLYATRRHARRVDMLCAAVRAARDARRRAIMRDMLLIVDAGYRQIRRGYFYARHYQPTITRYHHHTTQASSRHTRPSITIRPANSLANTYRYAARCHILRLRLYARR